MEAVTKSISKTNSQLIKATTIDPTSLATQIWQDVWSVSGATPEKSLYTFLELFIFKYLSDLEILDDDDAGNKVNFEHILSLDKEKAFKNYSDIVRPCLRKMFPEDPEDHTTIINGTVLNPEVTEHSLVFYKILKRFKAYPELKNIDSAFKSKVFEQFMKESISKKNWGQFFTPRNIIDAMVEMSDIDKLEKGAKVCDPACGVGGFILEPLRVKEDGVNFYYQVKGSKIDSRLNFYGFDKGFEKEEQLTIILAKANMLIFLSELMKKNPTLSQTFSKLFNSTFKLLHNTILGTLNMTDADMYDLVMTNPPYVTSGSSNYKDAIKNEERLSSYYKTNAIGVESLFLEWIVRSLKPSKKALVIIPQGILTRVGIPSSIKLREFVKNQCTIDAIISLPINAFYSTPQKTYILITTKKDEKDPDAREQHPQTEPVFTYLASSIGETLDVNRFPTDDNNLKEVVPLFNQFKGAKASFISPSPRCKIQPIAMFNPSEHWAVDRWWSRDEKVKLGIEEEEIVLTIEEFVEKTDDIDKKLQKLNEGLKELL